MQRTACMRVGVDSFDRSPDGCYKPVLKFEVDPSIPSSGVDELAGREPMKRDGHGRVTACP